MIKKAIFLILILGLISRAYFMKDVFFYDWDEGIYAETTSELFARRTLQPYFNGQIYLDKPPLSNYVISAGWFLIKDPEFGARLAMVVFAVLMLILTYLLSKKIYDVISHGSLKNMSLWERESMYMLPVLLTASTPLFLERSTQLNTDVMLGVAWLAYFFFFDQYAYKLIALSIGVWTKSLLGFYPLLFEILKIKKITFTKRGYMKGAALLIVPSLWYLWHFMQYGNYFLRIHLVDQIVKRAAVPIELHMGNKWYYTELLIKNLHVFLIVLGVSYIWMLWDVFDLGKLWKNPLNLLKKAQQVQQSKNFSMFLILFSALPFFVFLNLAKSKISWYLATIMPLFTLVLPYVYLKIRSRNVRYIFFILIVAYFMYRFVPATFALRVSNVQPANHVKVALCLRERPEQTISVLEPEQERKNRNYLEASHQQTETSFMYGGMPSFIYYTGKHINFYWKLEEFQKVLAQKGVTVLSKSDYENIVSIRTAADTMTLIPECSFGMWRVYSR